MTTIKMPTPPVRPINASMQVPLVGVGCGPHYDAIAIYADDLHRRSGLDQRAFGYDVHARAFDVGEARRSQRRGRAPALAEPAQVAFGRRPVRVSRAEVALQDEPSSKGRARHEAQQEE